MFGPLRSRLGRRFRREVSGPLVLGRHLCGLSPRRPFFSKGLVLRLSTFFRWVAVGHGEQCYGRGCELVKADRPSRANDATRRTASGGEADRTTHSGSRQTAVTARIPLEVLLVVFLGIEKWLAQGDLGCHGAKSSSFELTGKRVT